VPASSEQADVTVFLWVVTDPEEVRRDRVSSAGAVNGPTEGTSALTDSAFRRYRAI
jgi:hypothetical protein